MDADVGTAVDGRRRLLAGAVNCVAEHGMAGASVRKIAEYAGVTPGLVRHHFGGKTALLAECYRDLNIRALKRMAAEPNVANSTLEDDVLQAIKALFPDDLRDVREMRVLVAFWGAVLTTREFAEVQRETNNGLRVYLMEMMQAHLGKRPDLGPLADTIIAVTDGLWLECCMNPGHLSPDDAIERAHRMCCLAFRGLAAG